MIRAILLALLGWLSSAHAEVTQPSNLTPVGYCQLTSLASATALSSCSGGLPTTAQVAAIVPGTANVRYRDDGTAPTASVGVPLFVGATLFYTGDLTKIQFIAQSGSPTLDIAFYRY